MDAQGPGSPYQQTLQQEPRTNGATPTTCTISTSFHLSSRTIATPPPSAHPPFSSTPACTYYSILSTSLFSPGLANSTRRHLHLSRCLRPIKAHKTHTFTRTDTLVRALTRPLPPFPSPCGPKQAATRNGGSIMSVGLIGRSL